MKIALIPLDERPVNTRYPRMIAAIAGVEVALPPAHILSHQRQPANRDALVDWLAAESSDADRRVLSIETFAYGGLIPSRISDEPAHAILSHLSRLEALPHLPTTAFNVITRIPDANDAVEEPDYWAQHGRTLHHYSRLIHRARTVPSLDGEIDRARATLPDSVLHDFTTRRLRNHMINMHALDMAARGSLDLLVLSSDDTAEFSMGSQEKAWLRIWSERLRLTDERLLMYPGADEIGCVLVMRAVLENRADRPVPMFYIDYAVSADRDQIAPYEDSPIAVTVERQIRAIGGQATPHLEAADFIVAVNTPSRIGQEYDADGEHFAREHARRKPHLDAFAQRIADYIEHDRRVIVCDVAYPNGADPDLIEPLLTLDLRRLAAYGAWNTAGNTIGVALAQGVASMLADTPEAREAQQMFLLHRFIEDWGYQHLARQAVRDHLEATTGRRDTTPETQSDAIARIHADLNDLLPRLGALAEGWRVEDVHLPWNRTFEADFNLKRVP